MLEQVFYELSEDILTKITDEIEEMDKETVLDVEYSDGILNIVIEETGQTYVINRHSASQKIWFSSPISGADYFSFDEVSQRWLDDKNVELREKTFNELSQFISVSR